MIKSTNTKGGDNMTKKRLYELALHGAAEIWSVLYTKTQTHPDNALLLERERKAWLEFKEVQAMMCELEKNLTEE